MKTLKSVQFARVANFAPDISIPITGVAPNDPYIITNIDGLGPPDFNVNVGDLVNQSSFYVNSSDVKRQLVFTIMLNPDYSAGQSVADIRQAFYKYLGRAGSSKIGVTLVDEDGVWYGIQGAIEKLVPNPFSKDPQIQLTINCFDAAFTSSPFQTFDVPNFYTGPVYNGTAPTGFELSVNISSVASSFELDLSSDLDYGNTNIVKVTHPFVPGDELRIDTAPGGRGVMVFHGGPPTNLIGSTTIPYEWPMLQPGNNGMNIIGPDFSSATFTWQDKFWGI